jgi:hypothetical protein
LSEEEVIPAQPLHGGHIGRVQGERPFPLHDGLPEAPLVEENPALHAVSPGGSRVEGEGLRHQFVGPPGLRVGARTHIDRRAELDAHPLPVPLRPDPNGPAREGR